MKSYLALLLISITSSWSMAQSAMDFKDLLKLLPDETNGFKLAETPQGGRSSRGDMEFSYAESTYLNEDLVRLNLTIMDYKEAIEMYSTATNWDPNLDFNSDEREIKIENVRGFEGWKMIDKVNNTTQFNMALYGRYLFMIKLEGSQDFSLVQEVAKSIKINILEQ